MSGDVRATETDQEFADQLRSIKNADGTQKYSEEKIAERIYNILDLELFVGRRWKSIVVNKAAAKRAGVTTTTRHEFLHRIILSAVNSSAEGTKQIGADLMAFLESEFGKSIKGDATNLLTDLNGYKARAAESIALYDEQKLAKF